MEHKSELRKRLLAARDALPGAQRRAWSHMAVKYLLQVPRIADAGTFFTYVSVGSEPETRLLIETLAVCGKRVAVPFCDTAEARMHAYEVTSIKELRAGAYGIPAPDPVRCPAVAPDEIDVILVPGIAFALDGHRLGYGGGYYDRYLADPRLRALTVGLTYGVQTVDALPHSDTDVPVDLLCSEGGYRLCGGKAK